MMRIIWQTVKRINNEILGVKRLKVLSRTTFTSIITMICLVSVDYLLYLKLWGNC